LICPPSIDIKHTSRDDLKREYHKVQLTQGWMTQKVNKIADGILRLKLPLNIEHDTMVTRKKDARYGRI
jgi:hypothetical protein